MQEFWRHIAWSLHACWYGVWPSEDADGKPLSSAQVGKPLADGYFLVLWAMQADLEFQHRYWGLPYWTESMPCSRCDCTTEDMFQFGKAWNVYCSAEAWRERFQGTVLQTCALFALDGVSGLTVQPDLMHTKLLGVDQYCNGSVIYVLKRLKNVTDWFAQCVEYWKSEQVYSHYRSVTDSMWYKGDDAARCYKGGLLRLCFCVLSLSLSLSLASLFLFSLSCPGISAAQGQGRRVHDADACAAVRL